MKREEEFNFFKIDENAQINKASAEEMVFEDISSSTSANNTEEVYSLSDFVGKGHYKKKSRGFWGKFCEWWKNRKTWQKSAMITAASLVLVFAIAFGVLRVVFDYNYNSIDTEELGAVEIVDENIVNIALFGIDTRNTNSFKGNSDSIMILSLNTKTKKVKIISVMRDTLVPIVYNGKTNYRKINSAYATGGPELAIKTLNTIFGLDISEYATVNFYGMADIIEAVGGIEAELTPAEITSASQSYYAINGCIKEICDNMGLNAKDYYVTKSGKQHLNGVQAVAYSRIRYVANIWGTNNDYGRTDRQRYVMEQLFNKAVTLEKSQYINLAKSLIPCSETSLSYTEIMSLAVSVLLHSPQFEQTRIPQPEFLMNAPTNTGAGSVVYYDLDFAGKIIHAFIYDDITLESYVETNGIEKNDWYREKVRGSYQTANSSQNKPSKDKDTDSEDKDSSSTPSTSEDKGSSSSGSKNEDDTSSGNTTTNGTSSGGTVTDDKGTDDKTSTDSTSTDSTSNESGSSSGDSKPGKDEGGTNTTPTQGDSNSEGGDDDKKEPEKKPDDTVQNPTPPQE